MGLGGEQGVVFDLGGEERRGFPWLGRQQGVDGVAGDHRGIVLEGDERPGRVGGEGGGDQLEEGPVLQGAVDHLPPLEETVAGVLRVGVVEVHDLDDGRVALLTADEILVVEFAVALIHGDARQVVEGGHAAAEEVDLVDRLRHHSAVEGAQRLEIAALGHAVVVAVDEGLQVFTLGDQVTARALHPGDRGEAGGAADGHHVGGPGGGEVEARPHLHHPLALGHGTVDDGGGKQAVGEDEPEALQLLGGQGSAGFDMKAVGAVGGQLLVQLNDVGGHDRFPFLHCSGALGALIAAPLAPSCAGPRARPHPGGTLAQG